MEHIVDDLTQMGFDTESIKEALQVTSGSFEDALGYLLGEERIPGNHESDTRITQLEISQYTFESQGSSSCTAIAIHASFGLLKSMKLGLDIHDQGIYPLIVTTILLI